MICFVQICETGVVPPLVLFLCKNPIVDKFDLSSLKSIVVGAAPIGKELIEEFQNKFPHCRVRQGELT